MKLIAFSLMLLSAAVHSAEDYVAWAKINTDGAWTAAPEQGVAATVLANREPSDIAKFCPAYLSKLPERRQVFGVGILSTIARPESNFKPETMYVENFLDSKGQKVVSRGLLQISTESANQKKHGCAIKKAEDLHSHSINLLCGAKILDAVVKTDGVIATYGSGSASGGGRYWSTLREKNEHLSELMGLTKNLAVCRIT